MDVGACRSKFETDRYLTARRCDRDALKAPVDALSRQADVCEVTVRNSYFGGSMLDWVVENKEWLFSGLGVTFLTLVGGFAFRIYLRRGHAEKQVPPTQSVSQTGGNGSVNINVGGNYISPVSPKVDK